VAWQDAQQQIRRYAKREKALTNEAKESLDSLRKVKMPFGEFEVPAWYIPPIFSALLGVFLLYLLQRRLILNALALKVVHLHLQVLQQPAADLHGFGAWAPFWLAPLPKIDMRGTSAADAASARTAFLGWRETEGRNGRIF